MKAKPIAKHFMLAFEGNLKRGDAADVSADLEDLYIWDEDGITFKDLPRAIPEGVRKQIIALHKKQRELGDEVERMLEQLNTTAVRIAEKQEKEEERLKPHCDKCGQVIKAKAKR